MWINKDNCQSIPINKDQIRLNKDQCRSMWTNANQCWIRWFALMRIDLHWFLLSQIDLYWSELICMILIESHSGSIPEIDRHWLACGIDPACLAISRWNLFAVLLGSWYDSGTTHNQLCPVTGGGFLIPFCNKRWVQWRTDVKGLSILILLMSVIRRLILSTTKYVVKKIHNFN